jgi:hypothetical protein
MPEISRQLNELNELTSLLKSHKEREPYLKTGNTSPRYTSDDTESVRSTSSFRSIKSLSIFFHDELAKSRLYRHALGNRSASTFQTARTSQAARTSQLKGSVFSQLSQISRIAVWNLPIDAQKLPPGFLSVSSGLYDINHGSDTKELGV